MSRPTNVFIKRVLAPVDGSAASEKALAYAIHLAKLEGSELKILHVLEDIQMAGAIGLQGKYGNMELIEGYNRARKESALKWIKPLEESAKREGVKVNSEILYDTGISEAGMIVDYAQENNIDLIVIGTRGLSKFKRLLVGSVANKVFNHALCPVLVVR